MTKPSPPDSDGFEEDIIHEEDGMRVVLRFLAGGGIFNVQILLQAQDENGDWITAPDEEEAPPPKKRF